MTKRIRDFFSSLSFRQVILFLIMGIVPALCLFRIFLTTYEKRSVDSKTIEILNQAKILANTISSGEYLSNPFDDAIDAQLSQLSTIYDGRVIVVNSAFRIVKDTYEIDRKKTIISKEVMRSFRGEEVTNYDAENRYIELTVPIIPPVSEGEEDTQSVVGVLMVSVSTDRDAYNYNYLQRVGIVTLITAGMAILLIGTILSLELVAPFRRLSNAIHDIHEGMENDRISVRGHTEVQELAERINSMTASMKILNDSRQEFVSNVSHELKTPLTSMKVLADSLNGQENVPIELYQEFMADITEEIDRENKIISELLTLVRMDKAAADLNVTSMNLNDLIELILKRLKPIADKAGVELVLESFRPVTAEIDEVKMTLAISNLVENAIKYNRSEGGFVHVTLNADYQFFYVTVEDNGLGIPEEAQEHIYERFYRADKSHSREIGGTGLGLSITRSAILMHRGSIKLHSVLGEGTTFTVRVPLNYIQS